MAERSETFEVSDNPVVRITLRSGDVRFVTGDAGSVRVSIDGSGADRIRIEQVGDTVIVESEKGRGLSLRKADVDVAVPAGADIDVQVTAGDVSCNVDIGVASIATTAGDVRLRRCRSAQLKTASGDVTVAGVAHDLDVAATSGDISVGSAGGALAARTASGDIAVADYRGDRCNLQSMAGDVSIGIPSGRTLHVDIQTLSGSIRNDLSRRDGGVGESAEGGTAALEVMLTIKTLSGDVTLRPA